MQHLSIRQASANFTTTSSLLEVRSALKATPWGSRYLLFLWSCKLVLAILAFVIIREPVLAILNGYLAAYVSLMFAREVVTLPDTFFLHRLSSNAPDQTMQPTASSTAEPVKRSPLISDFTR